jgi:N-methylhydantoinase A
MTKLAASLELNPKTTTETIITVANAVMERAIRVISIERGHDPREFSLICFGGAGGLHAVTLALALSIPRIIVPKNAGVFSAYGMVVANVTRDYSRTILKSSNEFAREFLEQNLEEMIHAGTNELSQERINPETITAHSYLDMRYLGQSHEMTIELDSDPVEAFHDAHEKLYG